MIYNLLYLNNVNTQATYVWKCWIPQIYGHFNGEYHLD